MSLGVQLAQKIVPQFPTHISQLNFLGHTTLPMPIDPQNPTLADRNYYLRRTMIGNLSKNHRINQQMEEVAYTQQEHLLWKRMFAKAEPYRRQLMCSSYLKNLNELKHEFRFHEEIPKINQLSAYLKAKTGFQIKPVAGIVSQRQFLNCLAFKVFCCGQFIRHPLCQQFSPQPDLVHEYAGHVPAFADKQIAQISQEIGLMSLGASDQEIERLGNAYFQSMQFGIAEEKGQMKVYGAAISSCIHDLKKIAQKKFKVVRFAPRNSQKEEYDYVNEQSHFWLTQSFQTALEKLRELNKTLKKPFECKYNEATNNIEVIGN